MDICDHDLPSISCSRVDVSTVCKDSLPGSVASLKESTNASHDLSKFDKVSDLNLQSCSVLLTDDKLSMHDDQALDFINKTSENRILAQASSGLNTFDSPPVHIAATTLPNEKKTDSTCFGELTSDIAITSQVGCDFIYSKLNQKEKPQLLLPKTLDINLLDNFERKDDFTMELCNTEDDENTTQLRFNCSSNNQDTVKENNLTMTPVVSTSSNLPDQLLEKTDGNHSVEISYLLTNLSSDTCDDDSFLLSSSSLDDSVDTDDSINDDTVFNDQLSSPLLEESSLDSGIASQDDQEPSVLSTTPNKESAADSGNILKDSNEENNSSLPTAYLNSTKMKRSCSSIGSCIAGNEVKRQKKNDKSRVSFNGVTIYYFPRKQSFVTVPSQGGSTLGMSLQHSHLSNMTLDEHKHVISRHRRRIIKQHKRQQKIDEKIKQLKQTYPNLDSAQLMSMIVDMEHPDQSSASSSDENDEDTQEDVLSEDEDYYFLQPIPTKKRRLLLRMAGVQRIDAEEKLSNKFTRESREVCGCDCDGVCVPSSCECALAGIPCQVDRESFPCGCVASGCQNPTGRVEFDADRVRNHHFRVIRKLRLEETGSLPPPGTEYVSPPVQITPYVSSDLGCDDNDGESERASLQIMPETGSLLSNFYDLSRITPTINTESSLSFSSAWPSSVNRNQISTTGMPHAAFPLNDSDPSYIFAQENPFQNRQITPATTTAARCRDFPPAGQPEQGHFQLQPVPTSTIPPIPSMSYFDPSTEAETSGGFPTSHLHVCKPSFKLDPIASLLPLNAAASRRVSDDSSFHSNPDPDRTFESLQQVEATVCSSQPTSIAECSFDSSVQA